MKSISDNRQMEEMREKSGRGRGNKRLIPGFGLTMGITLAMLSILILIPLASVLIYAFRMPPAEFIEILTSESVRWALFVSVSTSFVAALINVVFGLILAWVLVRYEFPGKRILDGLVELPFAIPTAVAGITLSRLYSDQGLFGRALGHLGLRVSYTHLGIIVALTFIGIPFVVRTVQPVLEQLDPFFEEASSMLGAAPHTTFLRVVLPELTPALLTGFGLAFARGIGEYGSVIYISGNSARDHTQVASYVIMQRLNYMDYSGATAVALVMLVLSFLLLFSLNLIQLKQHRRTGDA
ncbi:MAG: sulfate ABC transporter permease subunit CysT [Butyrivibrio sp.]|nr:sulfate ABC transporter permease subunit CysT [Butyrivibrio sp.]